MPRISPRLIKEAQRVSPLLPRLLRANRTIEAANQELKWIKNELPQNEWIQAIKRRSRLEPLQYILKSQPFGALDIECRKEVLIPRWETEEWCTKLAQEIVAHSTKDLKIVDACTGTGCIPLLLNYHLNEENNLNARLLGFDLSADAFLLSRDNLSSYESNYPTSADFLTFKHEDLFTENLIANLDTPNIDILVSNPPYIPSEDYHSSVQLNGIEKSVRYYEPSLALIGENEFYKALVENLVQPLGIKGFVFELGYQSQVDFVAKILNSTGYGIGSMNDGSGRIRCVLGWKKGSGLEYLQGLCNEIIEK